MAELAMAFAPAFLPVLFQIAADFVKEELSGREKNVNLQQKLEDLTTALLKIRDLQLKADQNNYNNNPSAFLKCWLDDLRDVSYEAIDLLDEHSTELLRRKVVHCPEIRDKISPANPKRLHYEHDMTHKIKELASKISNIVERGSNHGLNVNESNPVRDRVEITSSLPPTHVVGRENEKRKLLEMLLPGSDVQVGESKLLILALHGMGRIGKTTLAQLIYNDERILTHFDMRLWIHVSHEFDLQKVTRSILDSMNELSFAGNNFDTHQRCIQDKLKGKRYFLILDGLWNENPHNWENLIRPLHKGSPGSVIIVTTRNQSIANTVSTIPPYRLNKLSEHDCYSLVKQYACGNDELANAKLHTLRSKIFKTFGAMPEDAITLGYQLRQECDREKWNEIIDTWDERRAFLEEKNDFISSMRLSYNLLPSCLKPCLVYCSIIPEGLLFRKEWVVQLWTSQNFIEKQNMQRIEDIGNTYFEWLLERSFIQRTRSNLNRARDGYSIPDMVYKFLQHTSAEECCILEPGKPHKLTKTIRHMSIVLTNELLYRHNPLTEIYHCKSLYTLLVIGGNLINHPLQLPNDLLKSLGRLRTLDLSYRNLAPLPTNIGDLIHLRYLQLRNSSIQELPESVGNLYNLQTLGLRNCLHLRKLPKKTRCLRKLLRLDLHLDSLHPNANQMAQPYELQSMPPDIGQLTNLEVLSRFVVSKRKNCDIGELRNLNSLREELSILNLDLVKNPDDATIANLEEKKYIKRLQLFWRVGRSIHEFSNQGTAERVLESLKPSSVIKELNIVGYTGENFPSWLETSYLCHLHSIILSDCPNCIVLPSLGNLPKLQNMHIRGMPSLKSIECEFCGNNLICFPSLQKLVIENMAGLEKWSANDNCKLPHLNELVLKDCPNLQRLTHNFPSLTKLMIQNLPAFIGLRRYPSLKYLEVVACGNWIWDSWRCLSLVFSLTLSHLSSETLPAGLPILDSLRRLEINNCPNLIMLPYYWIPSGVTSLCIKQCPMLCELPKGLETLKSLEDLEIQNCNNLKILPEIKNLKVLTRLVISGCKSFENLPGQGLPDALHFLSIRDCPLFSSQLKNLQSPDRKKIKHVFSVWIDQIHFSSASNRTQGESSTSRR